MPGLRRLELRWWVAGALLLGCQGTPVAPTRAPTPAPSLPARSEPVSAAVAVAEDPSLVLFNPTDVAIQPSAAYFVDEGGNGPSLLLWPSAYQCPDAEPALPAIAAHDGRLALLPPSYGYPSWGCERVGPLPPGRYVLRVDSGHGRDLYATATISLPLLHSIEMRFDSHAEAPWTCSPSLARRAARLAVAAAQAGGGLPAGFLDGCDLGAAMCGATAEAPAMAPEQCTVTVRDGWVRVDRPAGDDAPRWLTANVDRQAVYASSASVTRASASVVVIDGRSVRLAGTVEHHMHEHGGDAARIGNMEFVVDNPHDRLLTTRVEGVEFLVDSGCALPQTVSGRPKLVGPGPKTLAPGRSTVSLAFEAEEAYQGSCDRFATRVTLRIAGKRVAVTSEHLVSRIDPVGFG